VDICIRGVSAGMGVGPVDGGAVVVVWAEMRIDRLVEVRSYCDYFTLNCFHTLAGSLTFPWPGTTFRLQ